MARTTDHTKMAALCGLLMLSAALNSVDGQSFQYSRGWTNGKRSDGVVADLQQRLGAAPPLSAPSGRNSQVTASPLLPRPCSALYPHLCSTPLRAQQGLEERVSVLESHLFDLVAGLAASPLTDFTDFLAKHKPTQPDYFGDN